MYIGLEPASPWSEVRCLIHFASTYNVVDRFIYLSSYLQLKVEIKGDRIKTIVHKSWTYFFYCLIIPVIYKVDLYCVFRILVENTIGIQSIVGQNYIGAPKIRKFIILTQIGLATAIDNY